jgi:hypothetical protein
MAPGCRAKRQYFVPQAQPVIYLLLQYRLAALGSAALAVDHTGAAQSASLDLGKKCLQGFLGIADGEAMQINLQLRLDVPTAQVL